MFPLAGSAPGTVHPARQARALGIVDTAVGSAIPQSAEADAIRDMAVAAFAADFGNAIWDGGLLTDELRAPLSGPGSSRDTLDDPAEGAAGGSGGWPYSSKYPWRRLSWIDARLVPERWNPIDTTTEHGLGGASQEVFLDEGYLALQGTRAILSTALEELLTTNFGKTNPIVVDAYRGELYALEGYTEILLADLFCAGVPLNTFAKPLTTMLALRQGTQGPISIPTAGKLSGDTFASQSGWFTLLRYHRGGEHRVFLAGPDIDAFRLMSRITQGEQVYTVELPVTSQVYLRAISQHLVVYRSGMTTIQVYQDAIAKFDTALTLLALVRDSTRLLNLARVGKGRAWLALGQYDSAAAAVTSVPKGFAYRVRSLLNLDPDGDEVLATVADREGETGLPYLSSGDPRTATQWSPTDKGMGNVRFPVKFWPDSDRAKGLILRQQDYRGGTYDPWQMAWPFTLASWEEAMLIRAEAALHSSQHHHAVSPTWLQLLNELRATAPIPGRNQSDPARLVPLKDPGTDRARIAMLFSERAYWLFLTGERQGDLRRLVREYHWSQEQVYPTGPYRVSHQLLPQVGHYGTDVNLPIPPEELSNPYFLGCVDRHA